jgi:hypothetical protein
MSLFLHLTNFVQTTFKKFFHNYEVEVCFKIKVKGSKVRERHVVPVTRERKFPPLTEMTAAVSVLTVSSALSVFAVQLTFEPHRK